MDINEIIRLYNKTGNAYEEGDKTGYRRLTFDEVMANQKHALEELDKVSKEELIDFIKYRFMKQDEDVF